MKLLPRTARRFALGSGLVAWLACGALAHTVSIISLSETVTSWSSSYPGATAPTVGPVGSWTFASSNGENLPMISSYSTGISGSAVSLDNVQCVWNIKWSPANPADTPYGNIILQERQYYTCEASALGNSLDTAYAWVDYVLDLGSGLSGNKASIGIGTGTMVDNQSQGPWVYGSYITVVGPTWTLQPDGTYNTTVTLPDSFGFSCSGYQTSTLPSRKQCNMFGAYDVEATLVSVADVNFTPFS